MHLDKIDDKRHRDALVDADVLQCAVSIGDFTGGKSLIKASVRSSEVLDYTLRSSSSSQIKLT
eukprot:scaffold10929_cov61-Cyclotella_meneghiniana.AAC.1